MTMGRSGRRTEDEHSVAPAATPAKVAKDTWQLTMVQRACKTPLRPLVHNCACKPEQLQGCAKAPLGHALRR